MSYAIALPASGSLRNRLRNASFAINQRAVSSPAALAAGVYGHDGVKAGSAGGTYSFAATGLDTTLTITAGTLILPIEAGLIEGGTYLLWWSGTAQARVWQGTGNAGNGAYASSPVLVTGLAANTQTNVEFSTGTVFTPQLEPGFAATSFDRRHPMTELSICQRYFETNYNPGTAPGSALGSYPGVAGFYMQGLVASGRSIGMVERFKVTKRSAPTITSYSPVTGAAGNGRDFNAGADLGNSVGNIGVAGFEWNPTFTMASTVNFLFYWTASAEL